MLHNEYETTVIVKPELDDSVTYGIVEKLEQVITDHGGHMLIRDDWGKRKLAYPIAKQQKGHYVLLSHLAPSNLVNELERRIRNDDSIIRFLTVKIADGVDVPVRLQQVAEQKRIREEQERIRRERGELDTEAEHEDIDEDTGDDAED